MGKTTIEWTAAQGPDGTWHQGYTFNPWVGCTKISPACDHCYAENWAKRTGQAALWTGDRRRTSFNNWHKPLLWNHRAKTAGVRYRVFCASLADVFDNQIDPAWRCDLWDLIYETPHLDWLVLTKRPQNIHKMLPATWGAEGWPNVWIGTTTENQTELDRRMEALAAIPAAVRFVSAEPLLGPLTFSTKHLLALDWIIVGGESGPNHRAADPAWFRAILEQARTAGVSFFAKQIGGIVKTKMPPIPEDLMVREFPR